MSIKIQYIDVSPGDTFEVRYNGSTENSVAISVWEQGKIMVSGPVNEHIKRFWFGKDGVEEIKV